MLDQQQLALGFGNVEKYVYQDYPNNESPRPRGNSLKYTGVSPHHNYRVHPFDRSSSIDSRVRVHSAGHTSFESPQRYRDRVFSTPRCERIMSDPYSCVKMSVPIWWFVY